MRKSYDFIDLAKFIFAFCVVGIHTEVLHSLSPILKFSISSLLFRSAVPFFMVSSSFFLGIKIRKDGLHCFVNYRKKLFPIFLLYSTINTILNAVVLYHASHDIKQTIISSLQSFVFYPRGAMWFVLALIIGSFLLEFILKHNINRLLSAIISLFFFSFALLCNNYYFVAKGTVLSGFINSYMEICISARNGVFLFVYMLIGYIISSPSVLNCNKNRLLFVLVLGFISLACEAFTLYDCAYIDDRSLFVSHLIFIPSAILCLTRIEKKIKNHIHLRNISTIIYYTHPIFAILIGTYIGISDGFVKFFIVSSLSILLWLITKNNKSRLITTFLR